MPLIATQGGGFEIILGGRTLVRHSAAAPFAFAGYGEETMAMYRGNFDISDTLTERAPLRHATLDGARIALARTSGEDPLLVLDYEERDGRAALHVRHAAPAYNRFWFRVAA